MWMQENKTVQSDYIAIINKDVKNAWCLTETSEYEISDMVVIIFMVPRTLTNAQHFT